MALWAVPAGLIGARLYHVITDNQKYRGHWFDNPFDNDLDSPLAIWQGGLGIPGGLRPGVPGDAVGPAPAGDAAGPGHRCHRSVLCPWPRPSGGWATTSTRSSTAAPPTCRGPSRSTRASARARVYDSPTFHPTFLYEGLWNLGLMGVIILVDRRWRLRPGRSGPVYVARLRPRPVLGRVDAQRRGQHHPRPPGEHLGQPHRRSPGPGRAHPVRRARAARATTTSPTSTATVSTPRRASSPGPAPSRPRPRPRRSRRPRARASISPRRARTAAGSPPPSRPRRTADRRVTRHRQLCRRRRATRRELERDHDRGAHRGRRLGPVTRRVTPATHPPATRPSRADHPAHPVGAGRRAAPAPGARSG